MQRIRKLFVTSVIPLTLSAACYGGDSTASAASGPTAPRTVRVAAGESLVDVLKAARPGDTILLAPGEYPNLDIRNLKFSEDVTVTSADPANRALIRGVRIDYSQGLTFKGLRLKVDGGANGGAGYVGGSNDIHFANIEFFGAAVGNGNGFFVRDSTDVSVVDSDFHHLGNGINHIYNRRLVFSGNKFQEIQTDGVRGGGSSDLTISGNFFTGFHPEPGDHPDAIQLWTAATADSARDITITNNAFVRGQGSPIQGIFVGNENKLPFINLTVTGNAVIGGLYHGISIDYTDNATVADNVVQAYSDMDSWLGVYHATNSTVSNNQATTYNLHTNTNVVETANRRIRVGSAKDEARITAAILGAR